ncbi:MAG TPA: outer membrane protein transport protein [Rhodocyclaceae bacterium]|nr:outer membrane protein transport protein [Rhodocyclaceae bacterium]
MQTKQKLLSALILGAFASGAGASGFQLIEQNASGLGNAYAGSAAVAENASTIFYNPAGMTELQGTQVSVGAALVKPSFKFKDEGSSTGALANGGNGGDAGRWGTVPNFYFSTAASKDLSFGVGVGAPFGLMTKYDSSWSGAAQSVKFDVKTMNINPSVAYRINETISIGGGLNWQRLNANYDRLAAVVAVGPFPASVTSTTPVSLSVSDESTGWNVGALIKLSPATKLGLSYRSEIKYHAAGQVMVTGSSALLNGARSSNVKADITLPDTFIASLTHQLDDRWNLLGDISWTGWSSIPKIDIIRTSGSSSGLTAQTLNTDFRNTWRVAVGANYKYSDSIKLKMGVAYDQTPVKGETTRMVSMPDNDRLWLSFGTQFQVSKDSAVDLGIAYLYVRDAKINNDQTADGRGTITGTYKDSGLILGAQYSAAF